MRRLLTSGEGLVRSCLSKQLGRIAGRNSCTAGWTTSLDGRATIRPPQVKDRRLSISVDMSNLPAGLDLLLHGQSGLHGWGQQDFGRDPVLLYPRGWDPTNRQFIYQVNETFGQNRIRRTTFSPFQVALTARVNVGRQTSQQNGIAGLAGIAFGGFGADARGGDRGGGFTRQGGGIDADALVERLIPEPVSAIVLLKDTLHLTPDEVRRLTQISDSLKARNAPIKEQIRQAVAGAGSNPDFGAIFQRIGPMIQQAGRNTQAALQQAQQALTPEQWRRVPAALKTANAGFFGGGAPRGGNAPRRPTQGTTPTTTPPPPAAPAPAPAPAPPPPPPAP
jgi:hypothetical protein